MVLQGTKIGYCMDFFWHLFFKRAVQAKVCKRRKKAAHVLFLSIDWYVLGGQNVRMAALKTKIKKQKTLTVRPC